MGRSAALGVTLLAFTVAAVCWLANVRYDQPSELVSSSVRTRVSHLETQAKEIEDVRQDATYLDHQIAELEKRGSTEGIDEQDLKSKASELRERLLGLAKASKLTPSRLLTRYQQTASAMVKSPATREMPPHRWIDDPKFKGADVHAPKRKGSEARKESIGVLAEVEDTKHDQAHYLHRFGGLGDDKATWEVAPKLDEFGQEIYTPKHYLQRYGGHRNSHPSWEYAPNESINGADRDPVGKKAKAVDSRHYLNRYGGHTTSTPSWAVMPKNSRPAWKVGPGRKQAVAAEESPAEAEATHWFQHLRSKQGTARRAREAQHGEQEEQEEPAVRTVEDFSEFRSDLSAKMARELRTLRAADKAVHDMQHRPPPEAAAVRPSRSLPASSQRVTGPLGRASSYLNALLSSADSKYGRAVARKPERPSVTEEAKALNDALEEAAERRAAEEGGRSKRAEAKQKEDAAWRTVEGMEKDVRAIEEKEAGMGAGERARLAPDVADMRAALESARETAAAEASNLAHLQHAQHKEHKAAGEQARLAEEKEHKQLQLTAQAVQAERQVKQVEARLAQAKAKAARAKAWKSMSKLDKMGVRTGEVHTIWGGDQVI